MSCGANEDRAALFEQYERLIKYTVRKYAPGFFASNDAAYEDVLQELAVVLLRAIDLWQAGTYRCARSTYLCAALRRELPEVIAKCRRGRLRALPPQLAAPDDAAAAPGDPWEDLYRALDDLPPVEADLLRRRFGLRCDQSRRGELAREYAMSPSMVNYLQRKALAALRKRLRASPLRP